MTMMEPITLFREIQIDSQLIFVPGVNVKMSHLVWRRKPSLHPPLDELEDHER